MGLKNRKWMMKMPVCNCVWTGFRPSKLEKQSLEGSEDDPN